jgi:alanyl-tRNA synthetase
VRRIEALTGQAALTMLRARDMAWLSRVEMNALRAQGWSVPARSPDGRPQAAGKRGRAAAPATGAGGRRQAGRARGGEVGGVPFLAQVLEGVSGKDLAGLIDAHKDRIGSGAVLLIADAGGKAAVAAGVTADLTEKVSAVDLVRAAVEQLGGKGGGGRPDFAQGGGKDASAAKTPSRPPKPC